MTDPLKRNANLVEALGSALREGGHAVGTVPGLLKRILAEGSWREFVTQRGEHVVHKRFVDFVTEPPLRGIGGDLPLIRRMVGNDAAAASLLDAALQEGSRPGTRNDLVNNINEVESRPRGTSKAYALRKLRKDNPELHAEVVAGRLTAHAAMVQAGHRPPTFTVRADSAEAVAATLKRRLPPDMLAELSSKLS